MKGNWIDKAYEDHQDMEPTIDGHGPVRKMESEERKLERIRDSWDRQFNRNRTDEVYAASGISLGWVAETYSDHVIVHLNDDGYARYPYTLDAEGNAVFGEPTKVEQVYIPTA